MTTTAGLGPACQELGLDLAGNGRRGCIRAWVSERAVSGSGGNQSRREWLHRQSMTAQRVPLSSHWSEASSPPVVGCASPRRVYEELLLDMAATIRPITSPDIGEER